MEFVLSRTDGMPEALHQAVFRYRHEVFVEKLGWRMDAPPGIEIDSFDRPETVHVVARDAHGAIAGYARLLPTTSPYPLEAMFPQLLDGQAPPCSPEAWELSRFTVMDLAGSRTGIAAQQPSALALDILRHAGDYAARLGAQRLVTVSPLAMERLLRRSGFHVHRAGPPMMVHGRPTFACWIELEKNAPKARKLSILTVTQTISVGYKSSARNHRGPDAIRAAWEEAAMAHDLFRSEVLEAKRSGWLGAISLAQPLRLWVLTLLAALAALSIALFLVFGSYTRRSTVAGQLVPSKGLATVLAPATGVVSRLDVAEGGKVGEGQTLAVVTVPRATVGGGDTLAALEQRLDRRRDGLLEGRAAQQQVLAVQTSGYRAQLDALRRELAQIEAEIDTRHAQIGIAEETLQRLRQLEDERYVSLLQIKQQESNALSWKGELQSLQRQAIASRRSIAQLQQALHELPGQAQASEAGFTRDLALLEQEQVETQARGALTINAPVAGSVSAQLVKPGQAVQAGQPLLSLLPGDDGLEAELLVPSRAIGFIAPGDSVLLRYQAFPYQKFGHHQGKVARISRSALAAGELGALIGNAQAGEPYYRVTVALSRQAVLAYGNEEPLKPGMLLDADILGERRRLIEWVFEPLYSLKGKVGSG